MPRQVQIRRGTTAAVAALTPAEGELLWNTETYALHAGNGSVANGIVRYVPETLTKTAASLTVTTGGTPVGTVATTRTKDGNYLTIPEVTGAPGFDVRFSFTSITHLTSVLCYARYQGSASHEVHLEIYNATANAWEILGEVVNDNDPRWFNWPLYDSALYISNGTVQVRFYHVSNGTGTHNLLVDYLALLGWP